VERCRALGITVPIVPGLKPLTKRYQLNSIPRKFFINLPQAFVAEVEKAKDDETARQIGIEWCIQQSRELKAAGVPCLHYYTMGDASTTQSIIKKVV
jgi:methylenetetrahydrofolate reductase (NADPH)